jgi:hypothetical protein
MGVNPTFQTTVSFANLAKIFVSAELREGDMAGPGQNLEPQWVTSKILPTKYFDDAAIQRLRLSAAPMIGRLDG